MLQLFWYQDTYELPDLRSPQLAHKCINKTLKGYLNIECILCRFIKKPYIIYVCLYCAVFSSPTCLWTVGENGAPGGNPVDYVKFFWLKSGMKTLDEQSFITVVFVSKDEEQPSPGQESRSRRWLRHSSWTSHGHQHLLQRHHEHHRLPVQP